MLFPRACFRESYFNSRTFLYEGADDIATTFLTHVLLEHAVD